jgi:hypothetical protein
VNQHPKPPRPIDADRALKNALGQAYATTVKGQSLNESLETVIVFLYNHLPVQGRAKVRRLLSEQEARKTTEERPAPTDERTTP